MLIGNAPCSWGINYPTGTAITWQTYLDEVAAPGSAAKLIADPALDAVMMLTPGLLHAPLLEAAIRAGKRAL
jgi:predicted dehydrogenase